MTDRRPVQPETRKVTRGGTTYDQRVTGINADRPRASPPLAPSLAWSPADIADDADDDELQPEAAAPPPPPPKFDHEAAAIREKAWDAITALSEQPAPEVVIAAWMKTAAPGHPVEKIERAIAWLNEFLPLYREAEPRRWAAELARLSNLKGQSNAA